MEAMKKSCLVMLAMAGLVSGAALAADADERFRLPNYHSAPSPIDRIALVKGLYKSGLDPCTFEGPAGQGDFPLGVGSIFKLTKLESSVRKIDVAWEPDNILGNARMHVFNE